MIYLAASAALLAGVVLGWSVCYFWVVRETENRNDELVDHIVKMRKQGFVPQFEFDIQKEFDPSEEIHEY